MEELAGYIELGMAKESLAVANVLLKIRPLTADVFVEAVAGLLIQADKLKPWRRKVEIAYAALNSSNKKSAATKLFHFYVSVKDWKAAREFIPKRTNNPADLMFSMWTNLNLKEIEKTDEISKKCLRLIRKETDDFFKSCLLEALGSYFAQTGKWEAAEQAWKTGQEFPSFVENAWDGLVKLHAYRGFLEANNAFESSKGKDFLEDNKAALMLPDNSTKRSAWVDKRFRRYAKHLAKVIPAKERWKFGR